MIDTVDGAVANNDFQQREKCREAFAKAYDERRFKTVFVSTYVLVGLLNINSDAACDCLLLPSQPLLPEDARIVAMTPKTERRETLELLLVHPTFEPLAEYQQIPQVDYPGIGPETMRHRRMRDYYTPAAKGN